MRRRLTLLLVASVIALAAWSSHPRAQVASSVIYGTEGTAFYGIGDLGGGGINSIVQEATQVGSTVYAVGASTRTATNTPIPNLDTAVVWDSASSVLSVIPDLVTFADPQPTSTNSVAYAITPDAQFVASRARSTASNSGLSDGIKVPWSSLNTPRSIGAFTALDISDDVNGSILFGQQSGGNPSNPSVNNSRAIRFDVSGATNTSVQAPLLTPESITAGGPCSSPDPTCLDSLPAYRGMSSDGSILVGTAFTGAFTGSQNQYQTTNGLAFRWVFNEPTVKEIPRPLGGTWSSAIAVSPDGNLTLAGGNSSDYPLGEVWIHHENDDTTDEDDTIEEFGSPNTAFFPKLYGGMTADGSVVGVTFGGGSAAQSPVFDNNPIQYAYLHNGNGWFHLANVLAAQGIDLWANEWDPTNMILTGIRTVDTDGDEMPDVDLVFGQGRRRNADGSAGATEGFVVSFQVGVLAGYQLPDAAAVENTALVGAWAIGPDSNNPLSVLVFTKEGSYYSIPKFLLSIGITGVEFERGVYTLTAANELTFATTKDRDGVGSPLNTTLPFVFNGFVSALNGRQSLTAQFTSADTFEIQDTSCSSVCTIVQATRIAGGAGSIVGGWISNDVPFLDGGTLVTVFLDSSAGFKYFIAFDGESDNGSETGTYTWDPITHLLELTEESGSPDNDTTTATLSRDELGLHVDVTEQSGDVFTIDLTRIVNPTTVLPAITNQTLEASGAEDAAFSYTVTAVNALMFSATGLPSGLTIDPDTGVISGTPTVNGTFNVEVTVTNTFGDTHTVTFVLTFAVPPAAFYAIGDLPGPGGVGSAVRDATRVGGTIYAVGAATANAVATPPAVPNLDTPVLWTSSGSATGTLVALPPQTAFVPTQTTSISAFAITSDAAFIASQARRDSASSVTNWVRVDQSLTNLNLSDSGTPAFAALALSDMGDVIYGMHIDNAGLRLPVRYEGGVVSFPNLSPTSRTWGVPLPRGTSTDPGVDGRFMVGIASNGNIAITEASSPVAFRYDHQSTTTTVIPLLTDGWWNMPVALAADGGQTVVIGNSPDYPLGAVYLTDAANQITATLGSPNTGFSPLPLGGMTADGVIGVTFAVGFGPGPIAGLGIPVVNKHAYIHNSYGWFHFSSVLAAQGIDLSLMGWDPGNLAITGIRTVEGMDLVFGQGRRRTPSATGYVLGAVEGFVAELPAGVLASFDPQPVPPADQSLVGTWLFPGASNPQLVLAYLADGTYFAITAAGFERGFYTWAGNGGAFTLTTLHDTNGGGPSVNNGRLGLSYTVAGNVATLSDAYCVGCPTSSGLQRVPVEPGSIVGGWIAGDPTQPDNSQLAVLLDAASGYKYFVADDGGFETGTYTWDAETGALVQTPSDGQTITATLTRDELGLDVHIEEASGDAFDLAFTRVIDPRTPRITSALAAAATTGLQFQYQITATNNPTTFNAVGLPAGLGIGTAGLISGTPQVAGIFDVLLEASNELSTVTGRNHLSLTVIDPVSVTLGPALVTPIEPESDDEPPLLTIEFENVTSEGTISVATIDPATAPEEQALPSGFSLGDPPVYYEIIPSETLTFDGPVTVCFSYAGVTFAGEPRLLHYDVDLMDWVDITAPDGVDTVAMTICGLTSSFSPFAMAASALGKAVGFHQPIEPVAGALNAVKGGATVPLKFNVYGNDGVEITDPSDIPNLAFQASQIACDTGAPVEDVEAESTGGTSLRYDMTAGQFVQNWKTPRTPGVCYLAKVTGDGLLLSARFKVK